MDDVTLPRLTRKHAQVGSPLPVTPDGLTRVSAGRGMKLDLAGKVAVASAMCRDERLSNGQCRVGIALLFTFHNTVTGECYPSFRQLAEKSRTSQGTVLRAINALEDAGYLDVERSDGGCNERNSYTIKRSASGAFEQENTPLAERKHFTSGASCSASGVRNTPLVIDALNTGITTQEVNTGIKPSLGAGIEQDALDAYCDMAAELNLQIPRAISKARRSGIQARIKQHGPQGWQAALDAIRNSRFLRGQDGNWNGVTLDWLLKPANFLKVIEGNYRDREPKSGDQHKNGSRSLVAGCFEGME
jgi:hypothetical protein